jgi:hypothetical protein
MRVSERGGKKQLSEFAQRQMWALRQSLELDHPVGPIDLLPKDRSPRSSAASAG